MLFNAVLDKNSIRLEIWPVAEAQSRVASSGVPVANGPLEEASAEAIVRVAETRKCALIVMETRGLGEL